MSDFDTAWKNADPDATGGGGDDLTPPPDGTYDVALIAASAFVARTSGKAMVKLEFKVLSVDEQDYEWTVLLGFKSQSQANMTKRQVRNLGINVDDIGGIDELDGVLRQVVGNYYTVETKTNGEFKNTYVSDAGPITQDIPVDDQPAPEAVAAGATSDDDIPF